MDGERGGRGRALGELGAFLAWAGFVVALSFSIAWPIWTFATNSGAVFTRTFAALVAVLLGFSLFRAIRRRRSDRPRPSP